MPRPLAAPPLAARLAALALAAAIPARAQEGMKNQPPATAPATVSDRVREVPALDAAATAALRPGTVLFADRRDKGSASPESGLIKFDDWRAQRPAEAAALMPFPGYVEPEYQQTINGVTKPRHETLKVYVAQGRFVVAKPPASVDLAAYARLDFVAKMDPVIKHRRIDPSEATPTKDPAAAFARRPDRPWCQAPGATCIESRYALEGKLPLGVRLANKLELGATKKVAEFVSFQSELRPLSAAEAATLGALTKIDTAPVGGLEQTIFWVNQILRFGTFVAVAQPAPDDPNRTIVTTFLALAVKADVLDRKQDYARVPVLKNLLPVQVLMGNSSFNTGTSISAGLPVYAKNRIAAFADALSKT